MKKLLRGSNDSLKFNNISNPLNFEDLKPLVSINRKTKKSGVSTFEINETTVNTVLKNVGDAFIAPVVVCGSSTKRNANVLRNIISFLNNAQTTTDVLHFDASQSVTKRHGIWIWPKPMHTKNDRGEAIAVLAMLCQGSCDEFTDERDIESLIQLSLFLSSLFILNFTENIEEEVFRKISKSSEIGFQMLPFHTRDSYVEIMLNRNEKIKLASEKPFQNINIIVQDWNATGENKLSYDKDSRVAFLNTTLQVNQSYPEKSKLVREMIKSCFSSCSCSLFPNFYNNSTNEISCVHAIHTDMLSSQLQEKQVYGIPIRADDFRLLLILATRTLNKQADMYDEFGYFETLAYVGHSAGVKFIQDIASQRVCEIIADEHLLQDGMFLSAKNRLEKCVEEAMKLLLSNISQRGRITLNNKLISVKILDEILQILETQYQKKRKQCMNDLVANTLCRVDEISQTILMNWDNSVIVGTAEIENKLNHLKQQINIDMRQRYPDVTVETEYMNEIYTHINQKREVFSEMNTSVNNQISRKIEELMGALIKKLIYDIQMIIARGTFNDLDNFNNYCEKRRLRYITDFEERSKIYCQEVYSQHVDDFQRWVSSTLLDQRKSFLATSFKSNINADVVFLDFGTKDIKNLIYPILQREMFRIMDEHATNTMIMQELTRVGVLNEVELRPLINDKSIEERDRMATLFGIINKRDVESVKQCLEAFCNLRTLTLKRQEFREAFANCFPECIKLLR